MPTTPSPPARRKLTRQLVLASAVAAAGISLLAAVPSLQPVLGELGSLRPAWIVAAIVLELASCASFVVVFRGCFDRLPARDAGQLAWVALATSVLLPGGGVTGLALGGWLMRLAGAPSRWIARRAGALFVLTNAGTFVVVIAAGIGLLAGAGGPHDFLHAGLPPLVATGVATIVLALPGLARRSSRARRVPWLDELAAGMLDAARAVARPGRRLLGAVGYLGFDIAVLWATLHAVGHAPPTCALVLAYSVGYLASLVPIPGGAGVLDGGLAAALILYGAPATDSATAVLLYHAIAFWLPSLGGVAAYARLRPRLKDGGKRRSPVHTHRAMTRHTAVAQPAVP